MASPLQAFGCAPCEQLNLFTWLFGLSGCSLHVEHPADQVGMRFLIERQLPLA
jgi:hypothetical protein